MNDKIFMCVVKDIETEKLEQPFYTEDLRIASRQFFLSLDRFPSKIRGQFELVCVAEFNHDYVVENNSHYVVSGYADYVNWCKTHKEDL